MMKTYQNLINMAINKKEARLDSPTSFIPNSMVKFHIGTIVGQRLTMATD